jgi:hypothetical protein
MRRQREAPKPGRPVVLLQSAPCLAKAVQSVCWRNPLLLLAPLKGDEGAVGALPTRPWQLQQPGLMRWGRQSRCERKGGANEACWVVDLVVSPRKPTEQPHQKRLVEPEPALVLVLVLALVLVLVLVLVGPLPLRSVQEEEQRHWQNHRLCEPSGRLKGALVVS